MRPIHDTQLLVITIALMFSSVVWGQVPCRYTVEYLPNPPPCQFWERSFQTTGISPNGRYVCGWTDDCNVGFFAVVVDTQTMEMTIIPRPPGVISMRGYGVNDKKELCGYLTHFLGTGGERAFLWREGVVTDLGVPGGATDSFAWAINNNTAITGDCYSPNLRAFLWLNGQFSLLEGPAIPNSGTDIDNNKSIVGFMGGGQYSSEAFLWSNSQTTNLGVIPGGFSASARAISQNGSIAGFGVIPCGNRFGCRRAFIYRNDTMHNIGVLQGFTDSEAWDTNDVVTVGECFHTSGEPPNRAFCFANESLKQLDTMQSNANLHLFFAFGISDDSSILATGLLEDDYVAVVLRPIISPEGDVTGDCVVNVPDLLRVIHEWGPCNSEGFCTADVNGDRTVNQFDILTLIQHWGEQS
jgi:uncharacterized membrane protein